MSALRTRAGEYLAMRRALGFGLATQGRHLMGFVAFCEERGAGTVTTDLAVEWATRPGRRGQDLHEAYQARKLDTVRIFARHLQALDPAAEVPPLDVLSRRRLRIRPYLYTQQEIGALMTAAGDLAPAFRGRTWQALIGLLAVTGMRQGEACRLARGDVDLAAGTVTIRDSKFGKSRMVFLHLSAVTALRAYDQARDREFPAPEADAFLLNTRGRPLDGPNLPATFRPLLAAAGIAAGPGQRAPRLHDLRHAFAVTTMLDWYRDGRDVQALLPVLSVSRRWDLLRPAIAKALRPYIPEPSQVIGDRGTPLADGTVCPTWDWKSIPDLYSGKAKYAGMNVQIACNLNGDVAAIGPNAQGFRCLTVCE